MQGARRCEHSLAGNTHAGRPTAGLSLVLHRTTRTQGVLGLVPRKEHAQHARKTLDAQRSTLDALGLHNTYAGQLLLSA